MLSTFIAALASGLEMVYFTLGIVCGTSVVSAVFATFAEIHKKRVKNT